MGTDLVGGSMRAFLDPLLASPLPKIKSIATAKEGESTKKTVAAHCSKTISPTISDNSPPIFISLLGGSERSLLGDGRMGVEGANGLATCF